MTSVTRHPATRSLAVPLALAALGALALPAGANQINTGGSSGADTGLTPRSTTLRGASSAAGAMPCSLNLRALGSTRVSSEPTVSL